MIHGAAAAYGQDPVPWINGLNGLSGWGAVCVGYQQVSEQLRSTALCRARSLGMRPLPDALIHIAAQQDGLFTRRQARDAGLPDHCLDHRTGLTCARVLPTVYSATTGVLSPRQRLRAAILYGYLGGEREVAILGGLAACGLHGLRTGADPDVVELMLPMARRLADHGFVVVRRTLRHGPIWRRAGLPVCSPARAAVDATRRIRAMDDVRAVIAECVQRGKATPEQISAELKAGGSAGSLLPRRVLAEVADGVHSVAEAQLRRLLIAHDFPPALWNKEMYDDAGGWLATPDARWPEAGLIAEVQSREWHLSPESWAATMRRTNRLSRLGYDVQQFPPSRIRSEPNAVLAELLAAYDAGIRREVGRRPA